MLLGLPKSGRSHPCSHRSPEIPTGKRSSAGFPLEKAILDPPGCSGPAHPGEGCAEFSRSPLFRGIKPEPKLPFVLRHGRNICEPHGAAFPAKNATPGPAGDGPGGARGSRCPPGLCGAHPGRDGQREQGKSRYFQGFYGISAAPAGRDGVRGFSPAAGDKGHQPWGHFRERTRGRAGTAGEPPRDPAINSPQQVANPDVFLGPWDKSLLPLILLLFLLLPPCWGHGAGGRCPQTPSLSPPGPGASLGMIPGKTRPWQSPSGPVGLHLRQRRERKIPAPIPELRGSSGEGIRGILQPRFSWPQKKAVALSRPCKVTKNLLKKRSGVTSWIKTQRPWG